MELSDQLGPVNQRIFMAVQCHEFERHRYFLSEQAGHNVENILTREDWVAHYAQEFRTVYCANRERIESALRNYTGGALPESVVRPLLGEWHLNRAA